MWDKGVLIYSTFKVFYNFLFVRVPTRKKLKILIQQHKSSRGLITIPPNIGFILMVYVSLLVLKNWPKDAIHSARIQIKIYYELICVFKYFLWGKKFIMVLINANSLFLSPHLFLPSLIYHSLMQIINHDWFPLTLSLIVTFI